MKKLLAVVLAILMLIPCGVVTVSAADNPTVTVGTASGDPGDSVSITVAISDNPGMAAFESNLSYDKDVLTCTKATFNNDFGGSWQAPGNIANPKITWYVNLEPGDIVGITTNDILVTFKFTIAEDAKPGTYPIELKNIVCISALEDMYTPVVVSGSVTVNCPGHEYGDWTVEDGNDEQHKKVCSICDDVQYADHEFGAYVVKTPAGCDSKGEKARTCSDCGYVLSEEIPATGEHTYGEWVKVDGDTHIKTCTTCTDGTPATVTDEHHWNGGEVTTEPGCDTKGVMTYTCTDCGDTYTEDIDPTGEHTYGDWEKVDETSHKKTCTTCEGEADVVTEAHTYDNGTELEPATCSKPGKTRFTCTACGHYYDDATTPAATGIHIYKANITLSIVTANPELSGYDFDDITDFVIGENGDDIDYEALKAWAAEKVNALVPAGADLDIQITGSAKFGQSVPAGDDVDPCEYPEAVTITVTPKYTVTYTDSLGGSVFADQTASYALGEFFPGFDGNDDRTDWVRVGWDKTFGNYVNANYTLNAVWMADINNNETPDESETKYTVTYTDGFNGEVFADDIHTGLIVDIPTPEFVGGTPEKTDYVFVGWTPEKSEMVKGTVTYTATWADDKNNNGTPDSEDKHYNVTYTDGVDGSVFADEVHEDILVGLATPEFTGNAARDGYVLIGWTPEVAETVTGDVTYTAKWGVDSNGNGRDDDTEDRYTVTYTDGVENEEIFPDQITSDLLENYDTPKFDGEDPVRDHYVFNGWTPEYTDKVTGTVTYTAVWGEDFNDNDIDDATEDHFTVTYIDGANGEVFKDMIYYNVLVNTATPGTDIEDPKRTNYIFNGWDKEFAELVTESVTYTATWLPDFNNNDIDDNEEPHYTVTYTDGANGEAFADQTYTVLVDLDTPDFVGTPERDGYEFLGWTPEVADIATEDATYTARWIETSKAYWVNDVPYGTAEEAVASIDDGEKATIVAPKETDSTFELSEIAQLIGDKDADISLKLPGKAADVELDNAAIKAIDENGGDDVVLSTVNTVTPDPDDRDSASHYVISIVDGNGNVDLGNGTVKVSVPFDTELNKPVVLVADDKGQLVEIDFNINGDRMEFTVNGTTEFVISEKPSDGFKGYAYINEQFHGMLINGRFIPIYHNDDGTGYCPTCRHDIKLAEDTTEEAPAEEVEEVAE